MRLWRWSPAPRLPRAGRLLALLAPFLFFKLHKKHKQSVRKLLRRLVALSQFLADHHLHDAVQCNRFFVRMVCGALYHRLLPDRMAYPS
jgi:hypothetical protein